MAIPFVCQCGKSGNAKDGLAGKRVKCPACGGPLQIPATASSGPSSPKDADDDFGDLSHLENAATALGTAAPIPGGMPQQLAPGQLPATEMAPLAATTNPMAPNVGPPSFTAGPPSGGGFTSSELDPAPSQKKAFNLKLWIPVGIGVFCMMLMGIGGVVFMWRLLLPSTDLQGHEDAVFYVAFSADGKRLVSASRDETIRVWDVTTSSQIASIDHPLAKTAISPDGTKIAVAASPVKLFDAGSGNLVEELEISFGNQSREWEPEYVAFSPDGKLLACSGDAGLKIWDLSKADHAKPIHEKNTRSSILAFSPDSSMLACADGQIENRNDISSGRVEVFDTITGEKLDGFNAINCERTITALAFSKDGKYFGMATANTDPLEKRIGSFEENNAEVFIWDAATRKQVTHFETNISQLWSIEFVNGGQSFVVCGGNPLKGTKHGIVKRFNTTTGESEKTIRTEDFIITCTAISPNGNEYAWATGDIDEGKSLGSMFRHASGKQTTKSELEKTMKRRLETMRFAISPL